MNSYARTAIALHASSELHRLLGLVLSSEIDPATGCWNWMHAIDPTGYGRVKRSRRADMAHRVSYEMFVGAIPAGLHLDHLCRNRRCVNPHHLEAVSQRTNILRGTGWAGVNARKTHCVRGHDLTEARIADGRRWCRQCEAIRRIKHRNKGKAA